MDQIKIGKFISEQRKNKGMTQIEFAEKLGVTNKSVSRWETGRNMPDVSLFIPICELLEISVNELIIGEKIEKDDTAKADKIIVETIKESHKSINKARFIIYISMVIINALFSIVVPMTASPSDAMAVPLAGVFGGFFTVIVISLLKIKSSIKFSFIPISALLFIVGSFLYFEDAVFDYGLPYAAIIAIIQFIIILISVGIGKLIQMIKSKK